MKLETLIGQNTSRTDIANEAIGESIGEVAGTFGDGFRLVLHGDRSMQRGMLHFFAKKNNNGKGLCRVIMMIIFDDGLRRQSVSVVLIEIMSLLFL